MFLLNKTNPSMRLSKYLTSWLIVLLLVGCSGLDRRETSSSTWELHHLQMQQLQRWTVSGKMALRTSDASESASLVWQQVEQDTQVQLSGPLGLGATTIHSDGQQLEVQRGEESRMLDISTPDAIALNTGWDLPLHALAYWLKGIPAPDYDTQKLELDPHTELLQTLQQDNWEISYERYEQFHGFILPTRVQMKRGATRAKVVITQWQVPSN